MDSDDLQVVFLENVRRLARRKRYSVNQLADFAGLGRGFMSELLRGKKQPGLQTIAMLAQALDVEPYELLLPLEANPKPPRRT